MCEGEGDCDISSFSPLYRLLELNSDGQAAVICCFFLSFKTVNFYLLSHLIGLIVRFYSHSAEETPFLINTGYKIAEEYVRSLIVTQSSNHNNRVFILLPPQYKFY